MKWPTLRHPGQPMVTLASYAMLRNPQGIKLLRQMRAGSDMVILDSGVFTARRLGTNLDPLSYASFAIRCADEGLVDVVVNMDIGDRVNMRRNYAMLRKAIGSRAHVLWVHQPFMGLDALHAAASETAYVGLGSAGMDAGSHAVRRDEVAWSYFRDCHRVLDRIGAACHGFAMTATKMLYDPELPAWATVDSSSWVGVQRFGHVAVPDMDNPGKVIRLTHPYAFTARPTAGGNRIPTAGFVDARRVLAQHGVTVAQWSAMSPQEATGLVGTAYVATGDQLAHMRPRPSWAGNMPGPLRSAVAPSCALVVIAEMVMNCAEYTSRLRRSGV